ncbi:MAG: NADH-quinone oxidoreductase subunit N [Gemmataceae bacterium]
MLPTIDLATTNLSLTNLIPELVICLGLVGLLLLRLFPGFSRSHMGGMALFIMGVALLLSVLQAMGTDKVLTSLNLRDQSESELRRWVSLLVPESAPAQGQVLLFGGMLVVDTFTVYMRILLYLAGFLAIWLTRITGRPSMEDSTDFYCLMLGSILGMVLMTMSNHLLLVYLSAEMASLPLYILAGFARGQRQASESALKYIVYGAGASGVLLYGVSLLAGTFGTGYFPDLAQGVVASVRPGPDGVPFSPVVVLGLLFLFIGLAFKIALVPFHFWCPDVFEGTVAEIAGFLSVSSIAAALALLARLTLLFGGLDIQVLAQRDDPPPYMNLIVVMVPALALIAALTATLGNLAALRQTNLKRMLAYSTIAHAGYMLMAVSTLTKTGVEALLYYLLAFLLTNLGAFAVTAFIRLQSGTDDLPKLRGLVRRAPVSAITLSLFLLSLLGIPPLAGFLAKFQVFGTLLNDGKNYYQAGFSVPGAALFVLLALGLLNTLISAFYYLHTIKTLLIDRRAEDLEGAKPTPYRQPLKATLYSGALAVAVCGLILLGGPTANWTKSSLARYRNKPGVDVAEVIPMPPTGVGEGGDNPPPRNRGQRGGNPKGKGGPPPKTKEKEPEKASGGSPK